MAIPRTVGLPLVVCLVLASFAMNADAQCRAKQRRSGEKILKNLSCVQAELPQGPQGPPGPPGPSGLSTVAYVDQSANVAAGTFDCVSAQCAPKDRIINCDAANLDPAANDVDPSTVGLTALGLRDPEDDGVDDLLAADTCLVCYANYNDITTVQILARAVCAVGGKIGLTSTASSGGPRNPPGTTAFRRLTQGLIERSRR
jgi:hypothetical protein